MQHLFKFSSLETLDELNKALKQISLKFLKHVKFQHFKTENDFQVPFNVTFHSRSLRNRTFQFLKCN